MSELDKGIGKNAAGSRDSEVYVETESVMQLSIEELMRAKAQDERQAQQAGGGFAPAPQGNFREGSEGASSFSANMTREIRHTIPEPPAAGTRPVKAPEEVRPQPVSDSDAAARQQQSFRPQNAGIPRAASRKNYVERTAGIKVVGIGGAGCNAVERMIESGLSGVEFIAVDTDRQALAGSNAHTKIAIGDKGTKGRGAGSYPGVGKRAMENNMEEVKRCLTGADLVFIAAGMGGGTGSGASPLIADIAKNTGALAVAVVTKPFIFEGRHRMRVATEGIAELRSRVDTLITVPNQKLMTIANNRDFTLLDAFRKVDDILKSGVQGIADIIMGSGIVNVDFADVQTILRNGGAAQVGIGTASGSDRALLAAQSAVFSPLLETSIDGAKSILFNITGDPTMSLHEVKAAADIIVNAADSEARIVFGAVLDEGMEDMVKITVVATGLTTDAERSAMDYQDSEDAFLERMPFQQEQEDFDSIPAIFRRQRATQ